MNKPSMATAAVLTLAAFGHPLPDFSLILAPGPRVNHRGRGNSWQNRVRIAKAECTRRGRRYKSGRRN